MSEQTLWGLILMIYILPFSLWQLSKLYDIEARKRSPFSTGEPEVPEERLLDTLSWFWIAGLVAMLAAYEAGWHPIPASIALVGAVLLALVGRFAAKRLNLLSNRIFRFWLASSVVWFIAVWWWYMMFGQHGYMEEEQYVFLFLSPPVVVAIAISAWLWAVRKP